MTARCGVVFALVFSAVVPTIAGAQILRPTLNPTRFTVGGNFILSEPKEGFRQNVGNGFGGGGTVQYNLLRSGLVGLRFDASGVRYGKEEKRVPISDSIGSRILVDLTTRNTITTFSLGPELAKPTGRIRPYVNAGYSRLLFKTTSALSGSDSEEDFTNTTNHKDSTGAWVYGGGLRFQLGPAMSPLTLDFGLRYHRGGSASYLREGSIQDNSDGSITINPLSSRTPFLAYTVGVKFRIPFDVNKPCARLLC
jgi:opacity protein-like surface antigen